MSDPNEKHPRTFQCRDALWGALEQVAGDLECSVDYLINEALKQYLRQRGMRTTSMASMPVPEVAPPTPKPITAPVPPPPPPPLPRVGAPPPLPPPPYVAPPSAPWNARPPPPPPPLLRRPSVVPAAPVSAAPAAPPPPPFAPPALPIPKGPPIQPTLAVMYGGQTYAVNKDRFIIGRGQKVADLTIKDPNISRQHAMVELHGGQYFIVDMGSTNGVEHNGQRIARRPIAEGDVVRICDHEVKFTFRQGG